MTTDMATSRNHLRPEARIVRNARDGLGLTRPILEAISGVSRATIEKIESGERGYSMDTALALADALKLSGDVRAEMLGYARESGKGEPLAQLMTLVAETQRQVASLAETIGRLEARIDRLEQRPK